ncbi:MAG: (2Fe-2S) ferredoxin domain-containing protein [Anaerolineae bacterium]|nr:(2Fe-2S) ferredoxin domain-containing protein [Anaerolineae bacterium]
MGSACHQYGVYDVLPALQRLMAGYGLTDSIDLKGAFCFDQCKRGITLKVKDILFCDLNPQNIEQRFEADILPCLIRITEESND